MDRVEEGQGGTEAGAERPREWSGGAKGYAESGKRNARAGRTRPLPPRGWVKRGGD